MRSLKLFLLFFLLAYGLSAQTITLSGKVTDQQGQPIPFVSIYPKNSTKGITSNSEGLYHLNIIAGKYEIVYKALGYKLETKPLDLKTNQELNVILSNETYELQTVIVTSNGEDPAYRIIRNAIKNRKSHLSEVQAYNCDVYIKGLQKLLAAPKKFLGRDMDKVARNAGLDSTRSGIIYLSESESKFSFIQPDKFHEEMISSKVSGSNRAFSYNRASDMKLNFYENLSDWGDLSNRPMISPIADNALFYYKYKLIGTTEENGETVNKIEVIPKRNGDPVFRGNIYIIEKSWRIHSTDLYLTKESNINFVDTLRINQQFFPVGGKIWMPSSARVDFTGAFLGFRFGGYYITIYKNYDLNPSLDKKKFSEVLHIEREVNKKDSSYWSQARPVPLTEEETADYKKKETLAAKRESKPYLDSLDKANNKFKLVAFMFGKGYTMRWRYKKETYRFNSLMNSVFYNTVEGFGINYSATYTKQIDSVNNRRISFTPKIRYGFSNEKFHASLAGTIPVQKFVLAYNLGSDVLDMNNQGSISQRGGIINSLLYEKNYAKLYEKRFVGITFSGRISGGLTGSFGAELSNRKWLPNSSEYRIRDVKDRVFSSNNPFSPASDVALFPANQAFKVNARVTYEFSKKYVTYPSGKFYLPSKYPRLGISYVKGINNIFGSDVDYDFVSADISKSDINLGLYGKTNFYIAAGKFLNNNKVYYTDYKHFVGTKTHGYDPKINTFILLDYYLYSTADEYAEAHLEHNFSGFILNKFPLIRKLKLQEIVGVNYLSTPALKNYNELYFGLKYLNFRGIYGFSFNNKQQIQSGFRFAIGF
jgi:hypothetical protein